MLICHLQSTEVIILYKVWTDRLPFWDFLIPALTIWIQEEPDKVCFYWWMLIKCFTFIDQLDLVGEGLFLSNPQRERNWVSCMFEWSKKACSYLGHAYPKWEWVNVLSGNKGCLSDGCDGRASLWKDDREKIYIHQNGTISFTDQGWSDEEVSLIRTHQ